MMDIASISFFIASFSLFLDFCFREGNIFDGWLIFWAKRWMRREMPELLQEYGEMSDEEFESLKMADFDSKWEYLFSHVDWFWFKPLGDCVVCANVWHSFLLAPLLLMATNGVSSCFGCPLFDTFVVILTSNLIVRILHQRIL
jgi:hypothetical protein